MSQSSQVHCVSGAFADFNKQQTIGQAIRCLVSLETTMNDVFDRILKRVTEETTRLGMIDQRIATAQLKVDKVAQQQTGTTIHCVAKYPAKEQVEPFKFLNHDLAFKAIADIEPPAEDAIFRPSQNRILATQEKALVELYSAVNPDMSAFNHGLKEGLGKLPPYLPSVSGMLLFDTKETPYKDYNVLASLMGHTGKERGDDRKKRGLEAAPATFKDNQPAMLGKRTDVRFTPSAPEIHDVQFDKLQFGGTGGRVATNVNYQEDDDALPKLSIAPTAHQSTPDLPALPALMDMAGAATNSVPAPPPVVDAAPPLPPPPAMPSTPAPPPAPQPVRAPAPVRVAAPVARPAQAPGRSAPGGLLAEIARGKKLKSAKRRKLKKKKKREPTMKEQLQMSLARRAGMLNPKNKKKKKKKKKKRLKLPKPKKKNPVAPPSKINMSVLPKKRQGSDDDDWTDSD